MVYRNLATGRAEVVTRQTTNTDSPICRLSNQYYNEEPPYTSQNDHNSKVYKSQMLERVCIKGNPPKSLMEM